MLNFQRKFLYRNSAVFYLFANISFDDIENSFEKEKTESEATKRITSLEKSDKITVLARQNYLIYDDFDKLTGVKKTEIKNRVLLKFHWDDKILIKNLFEETLKYYKKYRENCDFLLKIRNYYEINRAENAVDMLVLE